MARALWVLILILLGWNEIERFLSFGERGDGVQVVRLIRYVVGEEQTKGPFGSQAEPQSLFFVVTRVGGIGDQNIVPRNAILHHICVEIPHFISHVREAKPTQKADDGAFAVVRIVDMEGGLSLLLSQGSA